MVHAADRVRCARVYAVSQKFQPSGWPIEGAPGTKTPSAKLPAVAPSHTAKAIKNVRSLCIAILVEFENAVRNTNSPSIHPSACIFWPNCIQILTSLNACRTGDPVSEGVPFHPGPLAPEPRMERHFPIPFAQHLGLLTATHHASMPARVLGVTPSR